jgi:hypothetical protein
MLGELLANFRALAGSLEVGFKVCCEMRMM